MKKIKYLIAVIVFVLLVDVFGFLMWYSTDQVPQTKIYAGKLTAMVLGIDGRYFHGDQLDLINYEP